MTQQVKKAPVPQTMIDKHELEFKDTLLKKGKCKITFRPLTTRDNLSLLQPIQVAINKYPGTRLWPPDLMEQMMSTAIVNIEMDGFTFDPDDMGEYVNYFDTNQMFQIDAKIQSLMDMSWVEKKTSS